MAGNGSAGMLEGVAGQRAQRLELAGHRHPLRQRRSAAAAPAFNRPRQLGAPEQQQRDGREDLVLPRFEQIDEPRQLVRSDARPCRRSPPAAREGWPVARPTPALPRRAPAPRRAAAGAVRARSPTRSPGGRACATTSQNATERLTARASHAGLASAQKPAATAATLAARKRHGDHARPAPGQNGGCAPQRARPSVSSHAETLSPVSASRSRRSTGRAVRRWPPAAPRSTAGVAGASSQDASVSSPACSRAADRS